MGGGWRKLAPFRFLQALVKLQSTMGFALGFYGCVAIDPTAVFERERPSKNRETRLPSQPQSLFGRIFSETSCHLPPVTAEFGSVTALTRSILTWSTPSSLEYPREE